MNEKDLTALADTVLSGWNSQNVERVLACYTEDCTYLDPNTRGPVKGHGEFRRYLTRLFRDWRMHWRLREVFPFDDTGGGAFLWSATLTPAAGGTTTEVSGIDLVVLRGDKLSRNEVYFDRMAVLESRNAEQLNAG